MRYVTGFVRFWYDFIIGDDWIVAAGVIVLLSATGLGAARGINGWWLMLVGAMLLLVVSLFRSAPPR